MLHDSIVQEFECAFAEYVGAKYARSANSASSLIFLALNGLRTTIDLPSTIPIVVPNMVVNSGNQIRFYDDVEWVGHKYKLYENKYQELTLIDSAQEGTRNQYKDHGDSNAVMIFSFYPTKPVGGCDGGMVVSDNKNEIDGYRLMTLNGTRLNENSWERDHVAAGYKMHANSLQAYIANKNLKKLDHKNERLAEVCEIYNRKLGYTNTSKHLYRIRVSDNKQFVSDMKKEGINCGLYRSFQNNTSPTCQFGVKESFNRIITEETKNTANMILHDIKNGVFSKKLSEEAMSEYPTLRKFNKSNNR